MYESLISNLREHAEWAHANEWESPITLGDDLEEAIEAIEALQAELEKVKAENAQLRRERDAAVRDLESVATDTHAKDKAVTICRYHTDKGCCCYDNYKKVRDCPGWEWRGPDGRGEANTEHV